MIKRTFTFIVFLTFISSVFGKVPFATLYLEFEKVRIDGTWEKFRNLKEYYNELEKTYTLQKIWVDVENESYLLIEEPIKGSEYPKIGKLKYKDRHYTLDYDLMIAWDETSVEKIYDNYTVDEPDYLYYQGDLQKSTVVAGGDGIKRQANVYEYSIIEPVHQEEADSAVAQIMRSRMTDVAKQKKIAREYEKLQNKATEVTEWIWTEEDVEMGMFIRKRTISETVLYHYLIQKLVPNKDFDSGIFERTLSEFRVKVIEK